MEQDNGRIADEVLEKRTGGGIDAQRGFALATAIGVVAMSVYLVANGGEAPAGPTGPTADEVVLARLTSGEVRTFDARTVERRLGAFQPIRPNSRTRPVEECAPDLVTPPRGKNRSYPQRDNLPWTWSSSPTKRRWELKGRPAP